MNLTHWLPTIFSAITALVAAFAGYKAHQAAKSAKAVYPPPVGPPRRRRFAMLYGAGPNDTAGPADIANKIDGINGATGQALDYRLAAMFYTAHMFGLNKDYAFPEGPNVSSSLADQVTSLTKLLTRTKKMPDSNEYTLWDAVMTSCKAHLLANPLLNDDEVLSVNYKTPPPK